MSSSTAAAPRPAAAAAAPLPTVSVVIATRNRAPYLRRMLDRLLADDYPSLEIVVADGASTDGTVELLESYGSRIAHWSSERDGGEYFAYNKALSKASGEIVKFMADDDALRPGALRAVAEYCVAHPEVDIVFGQTVVHEEVDGQEVPRYQTAVDDPRRLSLRHWLLETQGVTSLGAFVRRRVFERIGPLATDYSCGDVEFWCRAASAGVRMGVVPDVVLDYHLTGTNGVFTKRAELARDMARLHRRYGSAATLWLWRAHRAAAATLRALRLPPLRLLLARGRTRPAGATTRA